VAHLFLALVVAKYACQFVYKSCTSMKQFMVCAVYQFRYIIIVRMI
jgi:hypothetical protein